MNTYYTRSAAGTLVRLSASFTDTAGTLTDPGAVTCAVQKPDGTLVTPAPTATKDSTGKYHADVDISGWVGGVATYVFSGTSPLEVTQKGQFNVNAVAF